MPLIGLERPGLTSTEKDRIKVLEREVVERDPDLASDRAKQDKEDSGEIKRVFDASGGRYGARKV